MQFANYSVSTDFEGWGTFFFNNCLSSNKIPNPNKQTFKKYVPNIVRLLDYHNIAKHGNKAAFETMILSEKKMAPYQRAVFFSGQRFSILKYFPWNYFISSVLKIQDFSLHLWKWDLKFKWDSSFPYYDPLYKLSSYLVLV